MSFISSQFILFFVLVATLYFVLQHKFRWILLLLASCVFYMAFIPKYIFVLFFLIVVDYFMAILMDKKKGKVRKLFLWASILSTITILFIFKYFDFFVINSTALARFLHWKYSIDFLNIILPLGLSFHTFQSLAYVIEVYRKNYKVERNFGIYSLYVMFFPQLVAGPIERPGHLLPQFYKEHHFEYNRVVSGLRLVLFGYFQKVVIADRLAIVADNVYGNPYNFEGYALIFATIAFSFQIFCDFAGYSNIAIGTARILGFNLVKNFDNPYSSRTISEFWNKWHMSLYSWFRDYLYIPLGGNRLGKTRQLLNILIVFLVSGLWHGANWTFVAWGGLNGIYLVAYSLTQNFREKILSSVRLTRLESLYHAVEVLITFSLITFSWILFRAKDFNEAGYIIGHLFSGLEGTIAVFKNYSLNQFLIDVTQRQLLLGLPILDIFIVLLAIIFMQYVFFIQSRSNIQKEFSARPIALRWSFYYLALIVILYYVSTSQPQFIYFQF